MNTIKNRSLFWQIIEYTSYGFVALFPFINYSGFLYAGSSTRAVNLIVFSTILGLSLGIWLLVNKRNTVVIPKSPTLLILALYLGFLFISGWLGLNFPNSFWSAITRLTGLWYFLNLGFLMWILFQILIDKVSQQKMILTVVVSTAVYSTLALLGPDGWGWLFKDYPFDGFTFGNSSFAGMYIFGAFILSVYYLVQAKLKKWWMYVLPVTIIINPFILNKNIWFGDFSGGLVGEARASSYVVALSIVALVVVWIISKIRSFKVKTIVSYTLFSLGLVGMTMSAFSLLSADGFLRQVYLSQATGVRPLIWEMSAKVIAERPVFGWGGDNFERVFEKNYDNRILQDEYGNEAWFDRAHNVFVDQAVDGGLVGLSLYFLVYLVIILTLIYSALRSVDKQDQILASVLIAYFTLHILELQTAFDTSISYLILAIMTVLSMVVFHRTLVQVKGDNFSFRIENYYKYSLAIIILGFFGGLTVFGVVPLVNAQVANWQLRVVGSSEKRILLYPSLFGTPIDKHAFVWRTVTDFQRGIGEDPSILAKPKKVESLKQEMAIFENEYREFLIDNPTHFRAHLSLADVLIYSNLFQVDKLVEAQQILDEAIALAPTSPQPYWMKAVAYVYMRKFDLAREYAQKGLALNPKIKQSQEIVDYVDRNIKTFPEVDLFFFKQI